MKRKYLAVIYLLVLTLGTVVSFYIPETESEAQETMVIPKEAIRLRILANSDLEEDQAIKRKVRDQVNAQISEWVKSLTNIDKARDVIKGHLPEIQTIAQEVVKKEGSNQTVHVEFGKVQFPTKLYGQYLYPAGEYEAILITLGEGKGANWWCVLFPPLCFLDFSNGVAVSGGFEQKVEAETIEEVPQAEAQMQETVEEQEDNSVLTEMADNIVAEENEYNEMVDKQIEEKEPMFVTEQEEDVEVKFFVLELWERLSK